MIHVYGCEAWAMMVEHSGRLEHMEMRMVRWICGILLRDRVLSGELRERMRIESVSDAVKWILVKMVGTCAVEG